ncbi:MAG TPA: TolC family protein, partial [Gemmataceae bacterium]
MRYALAANPRLAELRARAEAAWERVPQARALPDPMLATRVGDGMERITLTASQRVVSLRRLNAQARQAAAEAAALEQGWAAERLNLIAEVKAAYYRLYLIGQLLRINQTSQDLLRSLVKAAEAQVRGGAAGPGDVFRANLELARLGEESVNLRQELTSARADLNRLLNRPATAPLPLPESLEPPEQSWPLGTLVAVAVAQQPELQAARLRHEAALLGVRVARLAQVPELMLEAGWMYMNPDRNPPMTPPGPGLNAWMVGVGVSVPVWREKYRALRAEAAAETRAAAAGIEDLLRRYETMLADLLAQAEAARRTAELYDKTILPLARQTFETDRRAYQVPGGGVDFERVIENFRNLLAAEAAYHRAVARLA